MDTKISDQVVEQLSVLPTHMQRRVLDFARALVLSEPKGVPGKTLRSFAGTMTPEEAAQMQADIEETCENVDQDGW